jgi:hypothetical protein
MDNFNCKTKLLGHGSPISEEAFAKAELISGHFGVEPLNYSKKSFCVIRDPNELTFSYIKNISYKLKINIPFEELINLYLTTKEFSSSVTNLITKSLTGKVDISEYNNYYSNQTIMVDNCWFLKNPLKNYENIISFIEDNNIKVYLYESKDLYKDIFSYINLNNINIDNYHKVNHTEKEFDYLYDKYFDRINELNYLDKSIYDYFKK